MSSRAAPALVHLLVHPSSPLKTLERAAGALANLTAGHTGNQSRVAQAGAIPALVDLLTRLHKQQGTISLPATAPATLPTNLPVASTAGSAMDSKGSASTATNGGSVLSAGGVSVHLSVGGSSHLSAAPSPALLPQSLASTVMERALGALQNLIPKGDHETSLIRSKLVPLLMKMISPSSPLGIGQQCNEAVQLRAIMLLLRIAEGPDGQVAIASHPGAVALLSSLLPAPNAHDAVTAPHPEPSDPSPAFSPQQEAAGTILSLLRSNVQVWKLAQSAGSSIPLDLMPEVGGGGRASVTMLDLQLSQNIQQQAPQQVRFFGLRRLTNVKATIVSAGFAPIKEQQEEQPPISLPPKARLSTQEAHRVLVKATDDLITARSLQKPASSSTPSSPTKSFPEALQKSPRATQVAPTATPGSSLVGASLSLPLPLPDPPSAADPSLLMLTPRSLASFSSKRSPEGRYGDLIKASGVLALPSFAVLATPWNRGAEQPTSPRIASSGMSMSRATAGNCNPPPSKSIIWRREARGALTS